MAPGERFPSNIYGSPFNAFVELQQRLLQVVAVVADISQAEMYSASLIHFNSFSVARLFIGSRAADVRLHCSRFLRDNMLYVLE